MRGWLEPYFGEFGAVIAQFTAWTAVVLAVLLVVVWGFRRYSGFGFGSISRGRVPRLAIVDAMALDKRRRLVLIRRDNIEHLILIGGPTDTVIEPSIQRPQARRGSQAATKVPDARSGVPAAADPPAGNGSGLPVQPAPPMPVVRPPPPPPAPAPQPASAQAPPAAGGDGVPVAMAQGGSRPPAEDAPSPAAAPKPPAVAGSAAGSPDEAVTATPQADARHLPDADGETASEVIVGAPPGARPPKPSVEETTRGEDSAMESAPASDPEDTAAHVGDLEREMARLLGEADRKPPS